MSEHMGMSCGGRGVAGQAAHCLSWFSFDDELGLLQILEEGQRVLDRSEGGSGP
jgi:hypothetical protein